jgi:hypothetical protein
MKPSWIEKSKAFLFSGCKVSPTVPNEAQLAAINKFTRRPFTADELYIGQIRLANNAIDRDNERFSESILQEYLKTAVRKTFLMDHNKHDSSEKAIGKFFDVEIEKMDLATAKAETGEDFILPAGVAEVWFLSPWFYIPRAGIDDKWLVKIDAGVFDFASIGYRAEAFVPVTDDMGATLFYEYRGRGEMTEGSLVYLGAQHGAGMKSATDKDTSGTEKQNKEIEKPEGGSKTMNEVKEFLLKLGIELGKAFSEDVKQAIAEIKALIIGKDAEITAQKTKIAELETSVAGLTPLAADGKAFRDGLVTDYVMAKAKLGEVAETAEAQKVVRDVAATYPIEFLKSEVKSLQERVAEKFPAEAQTKGDNRRDKSEDGKHTETDEKGIKNNPLVPDEK